MSETDATAQHAWATWLDQHGWRLLVHAQQLLQRKSEAEDLVQEVFLEFWRLRQHDAPPELALVLHKLRQRAMDQARSQRRRLLREECWHRERVGEEYEDCVDLDQSGRMQQVQKALRHLSLDFREVVSLKLWSELTFDDIGRVLQISRNTAASRYRLALEKLKPLLESMRP